MFGATFHTRTLPAGPRCDNWCWFYDKNRCSRQWKNQSEFDMRDGSWTVDHLMIHFHVFEQLQIWDTAGQERFRSITQRYVSFYHFNPFDSFSNILNSTFQLLSFGARFNSSLWHQLPANVRLSARLVTWDPGVRQFQSIEDFSRYVFTSILSLYPIPSSDCHWLYWLGNKTDRDDREIPTAIGEEFAKQQGMYFLETSAKEADNVERLFYEIAAELIEQARTKEVIALQNHSYFSAINNQNIVWLE